MRTSPETASTTTVKSPSAEEKHEKLNRFITAFLSFFSGLVFMHTGSAVLSNQTEVTAVAVKTASKKHAHVD